jgi:hypothetical protein
VIQTFRKIHFSFQHELTECNLRDHMNESEMDGPCGRNWGKILVVKGAGLKTWSYL